MKKMNSLNPHNTWIYYQLLVVLGTWTFAIGICILNVIVWKIYRKLNEKSKRD